MKDLAAERMVNDTKEQEAAELQTERYIPTYGQNVMTLPPQVGMEYTLDWLRNDKLDQYWPTVSRMSYYQLLSWNSENWSLTLRSVNSHERHFSNEVKTRFLKSTYELRERAPKLLRFAKHEPSQELFLVLNQILTTPLAPQAELDGVYLIDLVVSLIVKSIRFTRIQDNAELTESLDKVLILFHRHPSIPQKYSKEVEEAQRKTDDFLY